MHANIINKYKDEKIEELDHKRYYEIKDDEFTYLSSPTDLRGLTLEEIKEKARKVYSESPYDIYSYQYSSLLKDKLNPTMEDYFELIYSNDELESDYQIEKEKKNLIFMKLDERLYQLYKECFLRKYDNKL